MPAAPNSTVFPLDHPALRGEAGTAALVLKDRTLSFEALNRRIGQLAAWLSAQVAECGARVSLSAQLRDEATR